MHSADAVSEWGEPETSVIPHSQDKTKHEPEIERLVSTFNNFYNLQITFILGHNKILRWNGFDISVLRDVLVESEIWSWQLCKINFYGPGSKLQQWFLISSPGT